MCCHHLIGLLFLLPNTLYNSLIHNQIIVNGNNFYKMKILKFQTFLKHGNLQMYTIRLAPINMASLYQKPLSIIILEFLFQLAHNIKHPNSFLGQSLILRLFCDSILLVLHSLVKLILRRIWITFSKYYY